MLDLRTITFFSGVLYVLQLIVPLFYIRLATRYRGINEWAAGTVLLVVAFVLTGLRDIAPDFLSIVVANTLHVLSGCLIYEGCALFVQRTVPPRWFYSLPVLTFLFMVVFTYRIPNITPRAIYFSVVMGALLLGCARQLFTVKTEGLRLSFAFTASVFTLFGLFMVVVRIPLLFLYPIDHIFTPSPAQTLLFLANVLGGTLWTVGFAFMITQRLLQDLHHVANHDFLTETYNRRAAHTALAQESERAAKTHVPFSVLLVDIDHFKHFNDDYGHALGDAVLIDIADALRHHVGPQHPVARWGGEEFLVILSATLPADALASAKHLVTDIGTMPITVGAITVSCTISVGVATSYGRATATDDLIRHADHALYHAKHSGRNRAVAYHPGLGAPTPQAHRTTFESAD